MASPILRNWTPPRTRELTAIHSATGITFRIIPPGHASEFHPGPRRQFVITVSGEGEIGLGDGSVHLFGPGHVNLVEDTTGRGHTTRVVRRRSSHYRDHPAG